MQIGTARTYTDTDDFPGGAAAQPPEAEWEHPDGRRYSARPRSDTGSRAVEGARGLSWVFVSESGKILFFHNFRYFFGPGPRVFGAIRLETETPDRDLHFGTGFVGKFAGAFLKKALPHFWNFQKSGGGTNRVGKHQFRACPGGKMRGISRSNRSD